MQRRLLLLTPFLAGAAVMALELLGLRLLAPRFGASTYVWGSLLGAVMASLGLGYLLGGWLADRRPRPGWVYGLLLGTALYLLLVLFLTERLLDLSEGLGIARGALVATLLLVGPPMVLLGSVPPFVLKLLAELRSVGTTAGRVFALSTAGSLAGTFLTSFWLIPSFGSRMTLKICVAALLAPAVAGLYAQRRASLALLPLAFLLLVPEGPLPEGLLYRGESAYNTVIVEERGGGRLLFLNERRMGLHSLRFPDRVVTGLYYDTFLIGPLLAGGKEILVLGMAGGTTVAGYRRLFPGARMTAVEIDPLVVQVAREYFGVEEGPDLEVHARDARPFLAEGTTRFDVIEADLFAGGPYAPFYVLTREFFELARRRLRPNGVIMVNAFAPNGDRTLADAVSATMASVFPSVFEIPLKHNRILLGFPEPVELDALRARLTRGEVEELRPTCRVARERLRAAGRGTPVAILTDDRAPVESLTHAMLERYRRTAEGP